MSGADCNKMSQASSSNFSSKHNNGLGQPVIGHEFASNILVADLAIRATSFERTHKLIGQQQKQNDANRDVIEQNTPISSNDKPKRRVTFNMDNIQVQTIPAYDSSISSLSSETSYSDREEESQIQEEEAESIASEESIVSDSEDEMEVLETLPPKLKTPTVEQLQPQIKPPTERISKKASYDALQKGKQIRRDHQQPKPGYWYPLAANPRTHMTQSPLPSLRSLEMTEQLINQSIQREMALNPNIKFTPPSPSPSPPTISSSSEDERTRSMLIIDTSDEEEELEQASPMFIDDEEESVTILESEKGKEEESIYDHSFFKNDNHPPQLSFLFEHPTESSLMLSPPPSPLSSEESEDEEEEAWTDIPKLLIDPNQRRRGLFFVKILKTESLDFPIENDYVYCSIKYKGIESRSKKQAMTHTMKISHELRIDDVDPDEQVAITIHVDENNKRQSWYNRFKSSSSDLERYVHEKDGSICQTLFSPSRFIIDGSLDQTATLMMVNNWYKTSKRSSFNKKAVPVVLREKAVGKIYIQCLYVTTAYDSEYTPTTMDEAIEALNAKRFYSTQWQSGYLSQLGGNTKTLKRRYFTLTGGNLVAYSPDRSRPIYKIPLNRIQQLICDGYTIAHKQGTNNTTADLLDQLDSASCTQSSSHNNDGFQLVFQNGEKIHFSCDSMEERSKWIALLKVMICKLPQLPDWIIS